MKAWSFSALNQFETCPRQYYLLRVSKQAKDVKGEAALWGDMVHKHLERRARDDTPLPTFLSRLEPVVARIMDAPGEKLIEGKLTINQDFHPTEWFDRDAWCRAIIDIGVVHGNTAIHFDYKTGSRKPDSAQLKLSSLLTFAAYPAVDKVSTGFIWIKDNKVDKEVFHRDDVPVMWNEFLPRVERLKSAYERNAWPPKPSGLCKKYCPVGRRLCDYCGT